MSRQRTLTTRLTPESFWREAFTPANSVTPRVLPYVATFGLDAVAVTALGRLAERPWDFRPGPEVGSGRRTARDVAP